ncbi:hypothetical protein SUGI_0768070 [Cryptomeria japonica]|nr:hypothetical protein SUGI_0768070 [Cryptomeria japonica]
MLCNTRCRKIAFPLGPALNAIKLSDPWRSRSLFRLLCISFVLSISHLWACTLSFLVVGKAFVDPSTTLKDPMSNMRCLVKMVWVLIGLESTFVCSKELLSFWLQSSSLLLGNMVLDGLHGKGLLCLLNPNSCNFARRSMPIIVLHIDSDNLHLDLIQNFATSCHFHFLDEYRRSRTSRGEELYLV